MSRGRTIAYWIVVAVFISFGVVGIASIGLPFLVLGLTLALVSPFRGRRASFWPPVIAIVAFIVGFVLVVPAMCSQSETLTTSGATEARASCRSLIGWTYSGDDPSVVPALMVGAVLALAGVFISRRVFARRQRAESAEPVPPQPESWRVSGTFVESCNCESICPCRPFAGRPGGLSTSGECDFVLSWRIVDGRAGDDDLSGLGVVLAGRYWDDKAPDPPGPLGIWNVVLYVDERATEEGRYALARIFLGHWGGDTLENFAAAIGEVHDIRAAKIELDHTTGGQRIDVDGHVSVRIAEPIPESEGITCAIPGHHQPGMEQRAALNRVDDGPLRWELTGVTGFAGNFDYRG